MLPVTDATPAGHQEEVPYTITLRIKELLLMSTILFMGFTGFSLSYDKIYNSTDDQDVIPFVTVYGSDVDGVVVSN
jgi:hypothetical protein